VSASFSLLIVIINCCENCAWPVRYWLLICMEMSSIEQTPCVSSTKQAAMQSKKPYVWHSDAEWRQYRKDRNVAYNKRHPKKEKKETRVTTSDFKWNLVRERIARQKEADGYVHVGPDFMLKARQDFREKFAEFEDLMRPVSYQPCEAECLFPKLQWHAFAVIRQDSDDSVVEDDVEAKVTTVPPSREDPFWWKDMRRRPNVVCVEPHEENVNVKLEGKLRKIWRRVRRIFSFCPYTQLPEKDCWCLHRVHVNPPTSNGGDDDVDVLFVEEQMESSVDTEVCASKPYYDYVESVGSDIRNLIHIYLKEVSWNVHNVIGTWKGEFKDQIFDQVTGILNNVRKMDGLVGKNFYLQGPISDGIIKSLKKQKELMFVYTSNMAIRLKNCNKIVNDEKALHKLRAEFLELSRGALTKISQIRTLVNEAKVEVVYCLDIQEQMDVSGIIVSKPIIDGEEIYVVEQMEPHGDSDIAMPHSRKAKKLAFTSDRSQDESAMFKLGKEIDVTNILHRCMINSRLNIFQWATTDAVGAVEARYRVSPNFCANFTDGGGLRTYDQTVLCNYANMFQFWKGSLVYTFEAVCTKFHQGQLQIAFNPASLAAPTATQSRNLITTTMDLTQQNRVEFVVEYVGETEYKKCVTSTFGPAVNTDSYVNIGNVGILSVFVQNPLMAPNTVATTIDVNVYVRAGSDFTFKTPTYKTPGLTYYNVRSAIFEEMEVQKKEDLPPVIAEPNEGISVSEMLQIHRGAKVGSASTESIIGRDYLLQTGITWDDSDALPLTLATISLPHDVLAAADISINGLIQYHAFFRGTFDITFRMNAPIQYAGLLIMMYVPVGIDYTHCSISTWTQFPHVFFNPASETAAVLKIPWTYVTPLESVDPNGSLPVMGRVQILPWNALRIPVGGANTLSGTIWFRVNEPYIGLKRTQQAITMEIVEQMENVVGGGDRQEGTTSDSALKKASEQDIFQGPVSTLEGIMVQDHMQIYNLLRRMDFAAVQSSTVPTTANWSQILSFPPFFGDRHNFLRNSFCFSNGSNKVTYIVPVGANRGVTLATFPQFYDLTFSDAIVSTTAPISDVSAFFQGSSVWRPGLAFEHTVEIPFYHRDPVISIPSTTIASQGEYANVVLAAINNDTATEIFTQIGHTIGDDFRLYFPIAYGLFQGPTPTFSGRKRKVLVELGDISAGGWQPANPPVAHKLVDVDDKELQLGHARVVKLPTLQTVPKAVVDTIVQHVSKITGIPEKHVREVGTHAMGMSFKQKLDKWFNIFWHGLQDSYRLGGASSIGRRRRAPEFEGDDGLVCMDPLCSGWPESYVLPMKKDDSDHEIIDYDKVRVYREKVFTDEEVRTFLQSLPRKFKTLTEADMRGPIREEMPGMGGFTGVTTNTQVISQAFPSIATVGVVNTFQLSATAIITSTVVTDVVDITYTVGNVTDAFAFIQTVSAVSNIPTVINMTFPTIPTNALIDVTITAIGTGVVEHAVSMGVYVASSLVGTVPVVITGQPIQVTEYANLELLRDPWNSSFESLLGDVEIDGPIIEQMEEEWSDAPGDAMVDPKDMEEADVFADSLCEKMTRYASAIGERCNPIVFFRDTFESIHEWCTNKCTVRAVEHVKSRLSIVTDNVLDRILPVVIWMIDFVANLYVMFTTESPTLRTLMITSLAAKCVLAYRYGSQLLDKLDEVLGIKYDGIEMQGPDPKQAVSGTVATAMVAGIATMLGYNLCSADVKDVRNLATWKFAEACASFSKVAGAVRSIPTLWTAADAGIKAAIAFFIDGPDCFTSWADKNHGKLIKWQRDYDDMKSVNAFINSGLFKVIEGKTNFSRLHDLTEFAKEVRTFGSPIPHFNTVWLRTADDLIKTHANAEKQMKTSKGRAEPIGILFRGDAGCGKSLLCSQFLPHAIMRELGISNNFDETQSRVYTKSMDPKADYWDGYLGEQHVWVNLDDFGQSKAEEDIGNVINLISSSDAPVNMADLADKGILFVSDFVCCTTNLSTFTGLTAIKQSSALARRFPISVQLVTNPLFQKVDGNKRTLDHELVVRHLGEFDGTSDNLYERMDRIWTITTHNFDSANGSAPKGQIMTMKQLVDAILQLYRIRKKGFKAFTGILDKMRVQEQMMYDDSDNYETDEEEIDIPRSNRYNFVHRVLEAQPSMTASKARSFLAEVRGCNMMEQYGIGENDWKACKTLPDPNWIVLDRAPENYINLMRVLGYLKRFGESDEKTDEKRWPGLVKCMLKWCGVAAAGVVVVALLSKVLRMLFRTVTAPLEQGAHYDGSKALKTKAPTKMKMKDATTKVLEQVGLDERQVVVSNNLRYVRFGHSDMQPRKMLAIALDSRHIVFPEHFWLVYLETKKEVMGTYMEIEIRRRGVHMGWVPISVTTQNSTQLEGVGDLLGFKLDGRLASLPGVTIVGAKSIWSHLMTVDDMAFYSGSAQSSRMLGLQCGDVGCKAFVSFETSLKFKNRAYLVGKSALGSQYGDCGRPYVHVSSSAQHCLLGMHSLGMPNEIKHNVGITPLIRESIELAKTLLDSVQEVKHVEPLILEEIAKVEISEVPAYFKDLWHTDTMPLVGQIKINGCPLQRWTPVNTKYRKRTLGDGTDFIHRNWTNEYLPSVKISVNVAGVTRHPLITGAQKYTVAAERVVPVIYTMNAVKHFCKKIFADPEARALTFDESLNGFGTMEHLVMKTGAGYWGLWFSNGKTEIFDSVEQRIRPDGSVETLRYDWSEKARQYSVPVWDCTIIDFYNRCEQDIKSGKCMTTFWVSTLKDELVSLEKARIGKTRVFEQPCVVYTLLCRKYFGHFTDYYKRHAGFKLHHGIGKDKDSVWGRYYEVLRERSDVGFDVDYKNYDGTVQPAAFDFFLAVTDHYYGVQNINERHALIQTLQCSLHLIGNCVAESAQGNKSGNPLTDLFNSITNVWLVYVVYQMTREIHELPSAIETIDVNVDFLTYGDDVILSVVDECLDYFNRVTFARLAKRIGYDVTAANKSSEIVPYEKLEELTFLKSAFVQQHGYVAAPMPKKGIYKQLMWITSNVEGDITVFEEQIKNALGFMAHHGYEEYQKLRSELADLGVQTEDRFQEFEIEIREKQAVALVEDNQGRVMIDVTEAMLVDFDIPMDAEIDYDDMWLYAAEE